jgi:hypothetical protein
VVAKGSVQNFMAGLWLLQISREFVDATLYSVAGVECSTGGTCWQNQHWHVGHPCFMFLATIHKVSWTGTSL